MASASAPTLTPGSCVLDKYRVDASKLQTSEYCAQAEVDFCQNPKTDTAVIHSIQIITAFLNSIGGIFTFFGKKWVPEGILNKWQLDYDAQLVKVLPPETYNQCILIKTLLYPHVIHILVKPSRHLVTYEYNLMTRKASRNNTVKNVQTAAMLLTQRSSVKTVLVPHRTFQYGSSPGFGETDDIEFKFWQTSTLVELEPRINNARVKKCLYALPNLPTGGSMFIGIEESSGVTKIRGQNLQHAEEQSLTDIIRMILTETNGEASIWGQEGQSPIQGTHWDVIYHPVTNCPNDERRVVIQIHLKHCPGGVFSGRPQAYTMKISGAFVEMTFNDWKERVLKSGHALYNSGVIASFPKPNFQVIVKSTDVDETNIYDTDVNKTESSNGINLEQPDTLSPMEDGHSGPELTTAVNKPNEFVTYVQDPTSPPITIITDEKLRMHDSQASPINPEVMEERHTPDQSITKMTETEVPHKKTNDITNKKETEEQDNDATIALHTLSWSDTSWKQYIKFHPKTQMVVSDIDDILKYSNPLRFIPEIQTITNSFPSYTKSLQSSLDYILDKHENKEGVVLVSNEWLKNISCPIKLTKPINHLLDFMSLDSSCKANMLGLVTPHEGYEQIQESYVRELARLIKFSIMTHADYQILDGQSIFIQAHLYRLCQQWDPTDLDIICDEFFTSFPSQSRNIQQILSKLLLGKETTFKRSIGEECQIYLTTKQMAVILGSDVTQFNFIEGPPGSGKTLLALHVIQNYFKPGESFMFCRNPSLCSFCLFQGVRHAAVVRNKHDLSIELENSQNIRCLIVDDGHNLELETADWEFLFQKVIKKAMCCFVFMDHRIQNFLPTSGSVTAAFDAIKRKYPRVTYQIKELTEVHRNTQKVASFVAAEAYGKSGRVTCTYDDEGDDVELKQLQNLESKGEDNGLLNFIKELIQPEEQVAGNVTSYEPRDIAVLVDGEGAQTDLKLYRQILQKFVPNSNVQTSSVFPVTGVVVDTVDSFSGLEAKVIILVDKYSSMSDNGEARSIIRHISNPKYKSFVASRGIYRVVFVTENQPTFNMVDLMNIDKDNLIEKIRSTPKEYRIMTVGPVYRGRFDVALIDVGAVAVCPISSRIVVSYMYTDSLHVLKPNLELLNVSKFGGNNGAAFSNRGLLYLSKSKKNVIMVCDLYEGVVEVRGKHGKKGQGKGEYCDPSGLATDSSDQVYVCDMSNSRIQILRSVGAYDLQYVREFQLPLTPEGDRPQPINISVKDDRVAVTDRKGDLYLLRPDGSHTHTIRGDPSVTLPPVPGRLGKARCVQFDAFGNLIVSDHMTAYLHVLKADNPTPGQGRIISNAAVTSLKHRWGPQISVTSDGNILVGGHSQLVRLDIT